MDVDVENLTRQSREAPLNPVLELDFNWPPDFDLPWFSESLVSLSGHPAYSALDPGQKVRLAQKEFCLLCSVSCSGEKEVIGNVAKIMLKQKFKSVRPYLHQFIGEENNHIYMFTQFCDHFDQLYPVRYVYAQGDIWKDAEIDDLMVFLHVMIFEELGDSFNRLLAEDAGLPPLVRRINEIHYIEEARHINFGRKIVAALAAEIIPRLSPSKLHALQEHLARYLDTRHYDYHNLQIYEAVGVPDAFEVREQVIASQDVGFFCKGGPHARAKVLGLLQFLQSVGLIGGHRLLAAPAEAALSTH